jgi:cell shape-determining protein MreC
MLRIFFILSIIAGLGTIVLTQVKVKPAINTLKDEKRTLEGNLSSAKDAERKAKSSEKEALAAKETLSSELAQTQDDLQSAQANLIVQQRRADALDQDLSVTREAKNIAEQSLNRFTATGVSVEDILGMDKRLRETALERDIFIGENKLLARSVSQLESEIKHLVGDDHYKVPLPEGLTGNILAVDSTWDFVVLDIGSEDGVLKRGEMLVNRSGQLVAKVSISSVMESSSIANILPAWREAELTAGDEVIH